MYVQTGVPLRVEGTPITNSSVVPTGLSQGLGHHLWLQWPLPGKDVFLPLLQIFVCVLPKSSVFSTVTDQLGISCIRLELIHCFQLPNTSLI